MYIHTKEVVEVALKLFPSYSGRKFEVRVFQGPQRLDSCWSGGSRDYWALINLATGKMGFVPENGTPFTDQIGELQSLPLNCVLGCHTIFCGKDLGITLYVHPDNIKCYQIEALDTLTREEKIVLVATRCLKSSYAGISNYRFHEAHEDTGIILEDWNIAKASCQAKGLLNKAGAITESGRNAVPHESFNNLRVFKEQVIG